MHEHTKGSSTMRSHRAPRGLATRSFCVASLTEGTRRTPTCVLDDEQPLLGVVRHTHLAIHLADGLLSQRPVREPGKQQQREWGRLLGTRGTWLSSRGSGVGCWARAAHGSAAEERAGTA